MHCKAYRRPQSADINARVVIVWFLPEGKTGWQKQLKQSGKGVNIRIVTAYHWVSPVNSCNGYFTLYIYILDFIYNDFYCGEPQ